MNIHSRYFHATLIEPTNHTLVVTFAEYLPKVSAWLKRKGISHQPFPDTNNRKYGGCVIQNDGITIMVLFPDNYEEILIHETSHAVGFAWEEAGAGEELELSGEVLAYCMGKTGQFVFDAFSGLCKTYVEENQHDEEKK